MKHLGILILVILGIGTCNGSAAAQKITWDDKYPKFDQTLVVLKGSYDLSNTNYITENIVAEYFILSKSGNSLYEDRKVMIVPDKVKMNCIEIDSKTNGTFSCTGAVPAGTYQVFIRIRIRNTATDNLYWLNAQIQEVTVK